MAIKAIYFDDEIVRPGREAQRIRDLLQVKGKFECELQLPPKTFADLPTSFPDAFLIDLDLKTAPLGIEPVSYYGSTLASEIRMRSQECPIVLVTQKGFLGINYQLLMESIDIDLIVYKDEIEKDPNKIRTDIIILIEGFKAINSIVGQQWYRVLALTKATDEEERLLREASPPLIHKEWIVPKVARWIRNVFIGYPGILYDELTAATRLGISLEAFQTQEIQDLMKDAKYEGVFGNYEKRWWRDRLFRIGQGLMINHNLRGSLSQQFAKAFSLECGKELGPAICIYDGTPIADWVCYLLQKPVKQQHSIPYYPDNRPSVMDQARVSFKAIMEDNNFDERLVDADSYEVVRELWEKG